MLSAAYREGSFILRVVIESSSETYDRSHRRVDRASVSDGRAAVSVNFQLRSECLAHAAGALNVVPYNQHVGSCQLTDGASYCYCAES